MNRIGALALSMLAIVAAIAAASPAEVAPRLADEGFFREPGADATDTVVGGAVSDARSAGGRLSVVVLAGEPTAGATVYADATLDRLPGQRGTVLVVAPVTVGWASSGDIWSTEQLDAALDASLDGTTSNDVVTIFVAELTGSGASGGSSGGSSGLWILAIVVLVAGGIAFVVWRSRRSSRRRAGEVLRTMKAETQSRIDALANDILEDEDEIESSGNEDAERRFDQATAIYAVVEDELERADTPRAVMAVASDVDEAIWHLDCAEAILDGQPLPPKPEPPKPEPQQPQPSTPTSQPSSGATAPLPTYQRRSTRRSSYGAGDMMKTMLAMQAMRSMSRGGFGGGSRSSRSGSGARSSGRSRSSSGGSRRSRGGGRRRG